MPLLTVTDLKKRFNLESGFFAKLGRYVNAVNNVSFYVDKNESYGLVGESGCGKTSTARLIVRMYNADSGTIIYCHENSSVNVGLLQGTQLRQYRRQVKYVFQDPARSLNPRMNVFEVLVSGYRRGNPGSKAMGNGILREKAAAALEEVGLSASDMEKLPNEFSGGQRQRISIARSLLPQPQLLICDEVVSALDVSIQSQILNLLLEIRSKRGMSFIFIAHDLKVACYFCDRIGVMYSGELVEEAPAADLWKESFHPYTQMLFSSVTGANAYSNDASLPSRKSTASPYCPFASRCPKAKGCCYEEIPVMRKITPNHFVRCHF